MLNTQYSTVIGVFGRRNTGKSSLINLLAGHDVAIVSPIPGTTTDPVKKRMEIFGLGAVTLIDTPGIDDHGALGRLRTNRTRQVINLIDAAILLLSDNRITTFEQTLMQSFHNEAIPFLVLHNKTDKQEASPQTRLLIKKHCPIPLIDFVTLPDPIRRDAQIQQLADALQLILADPVLRPASLLDGLVRPGDTLLLVVPIDTEAPEGRLILPQVQTIRAALDSNCIAIVLKETEVRPFLNASSTPPALVITDSQLFGRIDKIIPSHIPLTGFSILLARHKGDFESYLKGAPAISRLCSGDQILIMENCTHQTTCDDIGRVKIPALLRKFTGLQLNIHHLPALAPLPDNVSAFALVIQCGACMITPRQLHNRIRPFLAAGVPVTNYGMAIAYMQGIFPRTTAPFTITD
ncbi:MAG: [FeFe] hydrogenase H-cluster maturation GTPase HydF [Prevotellaceae bacterium]|jgi:[FeFe] hydrogenase H-cluster maturation GTPase HydF|nr:[FeFe] hydrogenase H-cluster maturation GTPase HydF [Prevotellaceae bacterium]